VTVKLVRQASRTLLSRLMSTGSPPGSLFIHCLLDRP
jgi:hypothetical protein